MKSSDLKNIEYWAEEYRIPLFFISHSVGDFADNVLFLYENKRVRVYTLGQRSKNEALSGYRYFTRKNGFEKHFIQAEEVKTATLKFINFVKSERLNNYPDKKLHELFWRGLRVLQAFSQVYLRSEANKMKGFAAEKQKDILNKLDQVARGRLEFKNISTALFGVILGRILKLIAKRSGLKLDDLFFYTMDELTSLLQKNTKISIQKRKSGYLLWKCRGQRGLIVGKRFRKLKNIIANNEKSGFKNNILSGTAANKGKIRARVRLILHDKKNLSKEVASFERGRVLVTEMTRPQVIVACRKAAAIVTDEGGVTCHAAIVSRELKIPCVVGTKIATRVLKNGDLVEVDADKGIIRKIK